ncbi:Flp pilus assembly complex ATPase component TadA [bacterium]|nr:Flp pilus assembly complex ATPase component TadA [bacterium]
MSEEYTIQCWSCLGEFDAVSSVWCSCDPKNPSKLCPYCLQCFCNASEEYLRRFWEYAPPALQQERTSLRKIKDRLGELLVRAQIVTVEDMLFALGQQGETNEKLGQILVNNKLITPEELDLFLQMQAIPVPTEFTEEYVDLNMLQRLNPEFCVQRKILPLQVFQGTNRSFLAQAMANPQDTLTVETSGRKAEMRIVPIYADEIAIVGFLKKYVPPGGMRIMEQETMDSQTLIRRLIMDAIRRHASDIHIEPDRNELNVRYRIDGVLYKIKSPGREDHIPLIASLKKLAKMDVQNNRIPQSSKMILRLGDQKYQLNILSFPNPHGESISIKIVSLSTFLRDLSEIGLTNEQLAKVQSALDSRFGLILISGPLMNGVSTTEYSMMRYLASSNRKVMTLESPIFATIRHVHQSEINPSAGFDFITGLNSIIRSSPDVIFISDIPDAEVAATVCKIASRCIVVASLNAISSANTIVLLRELGASASLLSQSLSVVLNQRLIRRICPHCSSKSPVSEALLMRMGLTQLEAQGLNAYAGTGCKECNFIGFNGRIAIFEVLSNDPPITEIIGRNSSSNEIEKVAVKHGMLTLRSRCLQRINEGITTIEEFQKSKF